MKGLCNDELQVENSDLRQSAGKRHHTLHVTCHKPMSGDATGQWLFLIETTHEYIYLSAYLLCTP